MKYIFLVILITLNAIAYDSTIEIVKRIDKKQSIAVSDGNRASTFQNKDRFFKILIGDIKVSTNFIINSGLLSIPYGSTASLPNSSNLLLNCKVENLGGSLNATVSLYNTATKKSIYEKNYSVGSLNKYPFLAHNIIVDLSNQLGLPSVDWMKKFIVISKYTTPGNSEIVVADYTLTFQKTIVRGGLNIFPKWANKSQDSIYYTSYSSGEPTLYKVSVYGGGKSRVISSSGMMVCSDVSDDGSKLLLTMAPNDQPDVYLYDVNSGSKQRITSFSGIDVGGNFVDDGAKIVFISSRLGYPNVYAKSLGGGKVEQMVYHNKNNSSCTTHGKYIVYSSKESSNEFGRGTFNLYLISTQTDSIRKLTTSGKNMYPRFTDGGETVSFIKYQGGRSSIGILRLNANRSFLFPLHSGKIQSVDW